jgi:hypothetical protein
MQHTTQDVRILSLLAILAVGCSASNDHDPPPGDVDADGDSAGDSDDGDASDGDGAQPTWASWQRSSTFNFKGQIFDGAYIASDPCVLKDGATYRMFYTCAADATTDGLCCVTSTDGFTWTPVMSIGGIVDGLDIKGRPRTGRDENLET